MAEKVECPFPILLKQVKEVEKRRRKKPQKITKTAVKKNKAKLEKLLEDNPDIIS